ncbi:hypothetical protein [Massilia sp. TN1-12]|uniref:hypothetical protein n=1 Tax=Massilia paldalensis TaxID=3377675 RepID=UPI00384F24D7
MGKIHDRLKAGQQRQHTVTVDARVAHVLASMTGKSRVVDTARRMSVFLQDLDRVRADRSLDTAGRHFTMQRLATEAKALGLKGRWNLLCNRTQCLRTPAVWYNRGSYAFYCEDCARELNRVNARDAENLKPGTPLCRKIVNAEEAADLHCMS